MQRAVSCVPEREPEPEPVRLGSQYGQYSDSQHWRTRAQEEQRARREVPSWYSGESRQFLVRGGLAPIAGQEASRGQAGASEGDSSGRSTPFYFDEYLSASSRAEANTNLRQSYPTSTHSTSPRRRHTHQTLPTINTRLIQREESTRSPEERRQHFDRAQRLLERGPSDSSLTPSSTSITGRRPTHLALPYAASSRIEREDSIRSPEDRRAQFERAQRHLEGRRSKTASEEQRLFQKELEESGKPLVRRHGFPPP